MIVLTHYTSNTHKAQIRSSQFLGFKKLYSASCTASEVAAAKAVVTRFYGAAAAQTIRQIRAGREIRARVGTFFDDPKRKQTFNVWEFNAVQCSSTVTVNQADI